MGLINPPASQTSNWEEIITEWTKSHSKAAIIHIYTLTLDHHDHLSIESAAYNSCVC